MEECLGIVGFTEPGQEEQGDFAKNQELFAYFWTKLFDDKSLEIGKFC